MIKSRTAIAIDTISERMLLLRFGDAIDVDINAQVHAGLRCLSSAGLPGIEEWIPAYATLAVAFDPACWTDPQDPRSPDQRLAVVLHERLDAEPALVMDGQRQIEIPVCYDVELAPDLADAAQALGISAAELARRHADGDYRVAMLGFAPGFPYLLGLPAELHLPRRAQPRLRVAGGSVAIGGAQTGIYPDALPGGWHLIGRTPWRLFDSQRTPPNRLAAGDAVRFVTISRSEFDQLDEFKP